MNARAFYLCFSNLEDGSTWAPESGDITGTVRCVRRASLRHELHLRTVELSKCPALEDSGDSCPLPVSGYTRNPGLGTLGVIAVESLRDWGERFYLQFGTLLPRVSGRHWRDKGDGNQAWARVETPQLSWASHLGGPGASTTQAPFGKFLSPSLLGCAMGPWVSPSINFTVPLPVFTSPDLVSCFENFSLLLPGRSFGGAGRKGQVGQAEG